MESQVPAIDPRLLEDIRAGNCVAFVGAGFSAAAGLPPWPELVRAVARGSPPAERAIHQPTIDQLLGEDGSAARYAHRELEMAAQLLFDAVGEERCRGLLRETLRTERLPDPMRLRLKHLLGIPFRAIVTTNFDPLLPGVPPDAVAYRRLLRADRLGPWREAILRAALGLDPDLSRTTVDTPDRPVVPAGLSYAETLLREVAALRAGGLPMPPVMVFAGAGHEAENRVRALRLGAIGYTSDWSALMSVIERVLAEA